MRTKLRSLTFGIVMILAGVAMPADQHSGDVGGWCGTMKHFRSSEASPLYADPNACYMYGDCDQAAIRDGYIPLPENEITTIRMIVHILRKSDGTNPVASDVITQAQLTHLNEDYLPSRIQFDITLNYVDNTDWRTLAESEIDQMKEATAFKPDSFLNVWVTEVQFDYSFGTFPWSGNALTSTGGIVMGHFHWIGGGNSVFAHEVGHNLGLWHTFHGVDETSECGACYEYAERSESEGNLRGDFCSDTEPAPEYRTCGDAGGTDPCTEIEWGSTLNQAQSFMSYATSCYEKFTAQQQGRMRCWINSALTGWITHGYIQADTLLGPAPLAVSFDVDTRHTVEASQWDFGDGGTSTEPAPQHVFAEPGVRDITVDIQTPEDVHTLFEPQLVWAYADTLGAPVINAEIGDKVRVDVWARNFVPLKGVSIPFSWAGPVDLKIDSVVTAGLRTDALPIKTFTHYNGAERQATYAFSGGVSDVIAPDTGALLSLWFTVQGGQTGDTTPFTIAQYGTNPVAFYVPVGEYEPVTYSGAVTLVSSCCVDLTGNVNNDPDDVVDISDLTGLVNNLFVTFVPLACPDEGDVSGDGDIDISDVTVLVNHLFVNQQPLAPCP